jgi:hypothetical protein
MNAGGCPQCGSTQRRQIAPGYYECLSARVVGMPHGVASPTPVVQPCGKRYQLHAAEQSIAGQQCSCGMFAIGMCLECGTPQCGECGNLVEGRFLCWAHVQQAAEAAEAVRQKKAQDELRDHQKAEAARRAERESTTPGFPEGDTAGTDLACALETQVSQHKRRFIVGKSAIWHSPKTADGWGFVLSSSEQAVDERSGARHASWLGLVVTDTGICYSIGEGRGPLSGWQIPEHLLTNGLGTSIPGQYQRPMAASWNVPAIDVELIRHQVLRWTHQKVPEQRPVIQPYSRR